jgi:hypothetical protein
VRERLHRSGYTAARETAMTTVRPYAPPAGVPLGASKGFGVDNAVAVAAADLE